MITIIILYKLFSVGLIKNNANKILFQPFPLMFFFDLCRSEFLTYIICLLYEEFLLIFLQGKSTGNKFQQLLFIWKSLYCFPLLKNIFSGYTISRLVVFFFQHLSSFLHCFLVSKIYEKKYKVILIFTSLWIRGSPHVYLASLKIFFLIFCSLYMIHNYSLLLLLLFLFL